VVTDRNGVPFPPIRLLGTDDLGHCVALSIDRGWAPERSKWALLLAETEAFGVDAPDGGQVRLDLDPDRPELPRWAFARGLRPVARNTVMAHGDWTPCGTPDHLFAPISVALA
jgi:hypothetical protein